MGSRERVTGQEEFGEGARALDRNVERRSVERTIPVVFDRRIPSGENLCSASSSNRSSCELRYAAVRSHCQTLRLEDDRIIISKASPS